MKTKLYVLIAFLATTSAAFAQQAGDVRIVVPAYDIARGQVISDSDLTYQFIPAARLPGGAVTSFKDIVGMETRRVLRGNESVRGDDVRRPVVVKKGSTVTMTFDAPGITLTVVGKAINEGGVGDTVTVQNPTSFRQISAVVTGPGIVSAVSNTAQILASR